jgi:hypothetical protein
MIYYNVIVEGLCQAISSGGMVPDSKQRVAFYLQWRNILLISSKRLWLKFYPVLWFALDFGEA